MKVYFPENDIEQTAKEGETLLDVIQAAGLPIEALCSGRGTCGKCKVRVNGKEELACKVLAEDGMNVEILLSADGQAILTDSGVGEVHSAAPSGKISMAIDIGTTTVVVKALDTGSGKEIAVRAFTNPQRAYGADVLSRIDLSMDDASLLSGLITTSLDEAISDILRNEALDFGSPEKIVIAGNTTMIYLLLGLPCRSLGLAPFKPAYSFKESYPYHEIFHTHTADCVVKTYPYISAFVGGDIVSGLVNIEKHLETAVSPSFMLVDMGTNGEIAYRDGDRLLSTSTAAGPALEGGNIKYGMAGLPGAIFEVSYENDAAFSFKTIGDEPPVGICGSGVIDLVAKLLEAGFIESTGAFSEKAEGKKEIEIVPAEKSGNGEPIVFTQKDVREFQLAKGAIRAGIDILMAEMGSEPKMFYLAGGFGQNINLESAMAVGLIPPQMRGKIKFAGNTSLGGCVDACIGSKSEGALPSVDILKAAQEINLGSHKDFNNKFMETMLFPEETSV